MPFLPRMKFQIESHRPPEEIQALLLSVTDTEKKWFSHPGDRDFVGSVSEVDFKVMPRLGKVTFLGNVMYLKDSFLPVIVGKIRTEGNRTVVDVRMRLLWPVFAFLVVWFTLPVSFFMLLLLGLIVGDPDGIMGLLYTAGFILLGQILVRCGFYFPAKQARRKLEELLGEDVMEEKNDN